jgi:hypothetical protein
MVVVVVNHKVVRLMAAVVADNYLRVKVMVIQVGRKAQINNLT